MTWSACDRFISLIEILATKSVDGFKAAGFASNEAIRYSFLGFFAGILLTHMLEVVLDMVSTRYGLNASSSHIEEPVPMHIEGRLGCGSHANHGFSSPSPRNPQQLQTGEFNGLPNDQHSVNINFDTDTLPEFVTETVLSSGHASPREQSEQPSHSSTKRDPKELLRMGFFSALVIFLHNIPEGLATYVSVIADPYSGAAVAFAIALHNIPEASRAPQHPLALRALLSPNALDCCQPASQRALSYTHIGTYLVWKSSCVQRCPSSIMLILPIMLMLPPFPTSPDTRSPAHRRASSSPSPSTTPLEAA
jgi:hypothetical protein